MARGLEREQAILAATYELLGEVGYGGLTMDAVAARAQASKATIYRRWPGKPALVKAAMDAHDAQYVAAIPDTGTLRGDLLAALTALCAQVDDRYVTMLTGLMHAMRVDPELARELKSHVADEDLGPFRTVVDRAIARGELPADTEIERAHQVSEGQIMRRMCLGEPVDREFLADLVDELLIPLLTRSFPDKDDRA
ncbi:TetR/AcrR family transcriptional regulator [Nocardia transvalensis]|uniref:TetR/AcrR family transcriptional regulator n=1 Tax=Nocardia transvalensis TaxID=37333 RepID=UPI0018960AC6|nr:TetR/AcrR family transcriptional regulator [Nocardia transvalensis]MBF6334140.1 TetR/AcrR family transcriptional regulator [Nocardia transvalensis]